MKHSSAPRGIRLVIGLGNPGPQYENTRHNVGARVVEQLAAEQGSKLRRHRSRARTAEVRLGYLPGGAPGPAVRLAVADNFMNISGGPLARLAEFEKIIPEEILVVHDDLDLPAHELRLKQGGGEGGHNGLRSLTEHLRTRDYSRLRVGIGRPPGRQRGAEFVLAQIPVSARAEWDQTITAAAEVVVDVVTRGFTLAQQDLHASASAK